MLLTCMHKLLSGRFNPPKRMKIGALQLVVTTICAYVGVEGRPKVLSANEKKGINTYLDEILNILAEERNVSCKLSIQCCKHVLGDKR